MPPSGVWNYFQKVNNGNKVRCGVCSVELQFCKSTSTLSKHLKTIHRISLLSLKRKRSDSENSDNNTSDSVKKIAVETGKNSGPLDRCLEKSASFSRGGQRCGEVNDALLYMIATDNEPLSLTERKGFKQFVKILQPLYNPPCEKTVTSMMEQKYEILQQKFKNILLTKNNLIITTDLWTESMSTKSYLGLTVHYLNGIEIESITLGAKPMDERKTTENLCAILKDLISEWGIQPDNVKAVLTDNAANIVNACKIVFGDNKHIACFAHSLNIVAQNSLNLREKSFENSQNLLPEDSEDENEFSDDDERSENSHITSLKTIVIKVKKIVRFFRKSDRASEELKTLQTREWNIEGNQCLRLIQEVRTRWNSTFDMLDRFLKLSDFIGRVLLKVSREKSPKQKPPMMLTPEEEEIAVEIRDILKPMSQVTKEISSEKSVTLSKCIPLISLLQKSISNYEATHPVSFNFKQAVLENLQKRFKTIENVRLAAMATILDPRFKKMHFQNAVSAANAVGAINLVLKSKTREAAQSVECVRENNANDNDVNSIWSYHDQLQNQQITNADSDSAGGIAIELRQYLNRPVCSRTINPFEEWISMKATYPHLYEVAMEYLPILATSVPSERLFSKAGQIITKRRNRLSGQHLNQLIFLSSVPCNMWKT